MAYAIIGGPLGNQQLTPYNLPDTTARQTPGTLVTAIDPYWGGGEFLYVKAGGSIRQFGLVVITPSFASGQVVYTATEAPNTAGLGRTLGVAMVPASSGQFLWVQVTGVVPVNCQAAVAADTTFAIAAALSGTESRCSMLVLSWLRRRLWLRPTVLRTRVPRGFGFRALTVGLPGLICRGPALPLVAPFRISTPAARSSLSRLRPPPQLLALLRRLITTRLFTTTSRILIAPSLRVRLSDL